MNELNEAKVRQALTIAISQLPADDIAERAQQGDSPRLHFGDDGETLTFTWGYDTDGTPLFLTEMPRSILLGDDPLPAPEIVDLNTPDNVPDEWT